MSELQNVWVIESVCAHTKNECVSLYVSGCMKEWVLGSAVELLSEWVSERVCMSELLNVWVIESVCAHTQNNWMR